MSKSTVPCSVCAAPMSTGRGSLTDGTQMCRPCRGAKPKVVRTCIDCAVEYKWSPDARCSPCRFVRAKRRALEAGRVCAECDHPAISNGLCSTHQSYKYRAENGRSLDRARAAYHARSFMVTCQFCGGAFTTKESRSKVCSAHCANGMRYGWSKSKDVVLRRPFARLTRSWQGHVIRPRSGKALIAGQCAYCPNFFVGFPGARYCSDKCATNASWRRRYERRGDFTVSAKVRQKIYERDEWECQLCGVAVDPAVPTQDRMGATLDHVIPQSWQLIPDHSEQNLRLAHRICNSIRGADDVHFLAA